MNELEVLKNSLNISIWMFCVTLFLTVSTVTISAINMAFQRSHNRKSVKPFCNIHKFINENTINISIMNAGLGPMIIQKIVLLKNFNDSIDNGLQFYDLLSSEFHYDTIVNKNDLYVLPSMGEVKIFQYTGNMKIKNSAIGQVKNTLEGLYLCLIYKDIYDHTHRKKELIQF